MAPPPDGIIRDQSGAQALIGYVVDISNADRMGRVTLDVLEKHANRNGMLHGGITATILDAACGFTASIRMGEDGALTPVVTVSLTTSFVAGARIGSQITAVGYPCGGGRKIAHVRGELRDDGGNLIATCQGIFKKTPAERFL